MDRKDCGKRRNCLLRAISPFSTVFKRLVTQKCKNKGLGGKVLNRPKNTLSNFSFFPSVFKRLEMQTRKNKRLGGKGLNRPENTCGKGENAGNQHFLLFPRCFSTPSTLGHYKSGLCGKELTDPDIS